MHLLLLDHHCVDHHHFHYHHLELDLGCHLDHDRHHDLEGFLDLMHCLYLVVVVVVEHLVSKKMVHLVHCLAHMVEYHQWLAS